jgi:hypothetical protein
MSSKIVDTIIAEVFARPLAYAVFGVVLVWAIIVTHKEVVEEALNEI